MKIVFYRWVGVDSVAPAPDYLDRQSADCGGASRFLPQRRGVQGFKTGAHRLNRAMAHLGYADPDLTTLHDTACAAYIGGCELFQCRSSIVEVNYAY